MSAGMLEAALTVGEPNTIGETLRRLTFPESAAGEVGCYTTFAVREDARPMSLRQRNALVGLCWMDPREINGLDRLPEGPDCAEGAAGAEGYIFDLEGLRIEVVWLWDGDGWLLYRAFEGPVLRAGVLNSDCKKPHRWERFTLGAALDDREQHHPAAPVCGSCGGGIGDDHRALRLSAAPVPWAAGGAPAGDPVDLCATCAGSLLGAAPYLVRARDRGLRA